MSRIKFWFFISIVFAMMFLEPKPAIAQDDILRVAGSLNKREGKVTVYYPSGVEKQAEYIQSLIEKATSYYNTKLGIEFPISVVLFGPGEYGRFTKEKSGKPDAYNTFLPFVAAGPPTVMCLPANAGSALDSLTQLALSRSSAVQLSHLTKGEISQRFTAFVGLHELGHQYINELKIPQAVHWFQEMMANFIADAFLSDLSPADASIWHQVNEAYQAYLKPTNLAFSGIHKGNQENYVWWQGNITLRAHEVYNKYGFDFIRNLIKLSAVKIFQEDDLSFIIALDVIAPGFEQWAEKYGHTTNADRIKMNSIRNNVSKETTRAISQ